MIAAGAEPEDTGWWSFDDLWRTRSMLSSRSSVPRRSVAERMERTSADPSPAPEAVVDALRTAHIAGNMRPLGATLNGLAALAVGSLMLTTSSCSSCEAKCVGPHVEIAVSADVSEVTACTDAGTCSTQTFGPVEDGTIGRSFTVIATASDGKVPVTVSGKSVDGKSIEATPCFRSHRRGTADAPDRRVHSSIWRADTFTRTDDRYARSAVGTLDIRASVRQCGRQTETRKEGYRWSKVTDRAGAR